VPPSLTVGRQGADETWVDDGPQALVVGVGGAARGDAGEVPRPTRWWRSRVVRTALVIVLSAWGVSFLYQVATIESTCDHRLDPSAFTATSDGSNSSRPWFSQHWRLFPLHMTCAEYNQVATNSVRDPTTFDFNFGKGSVWVTGLWVVSKVTHRGWEG